MVLTPLDKKALMEVLLTVHVSYIHFSLIFSLIDFFFLSIIHGFRYANIVTEHTFIELAVEVSGMFLI